MRIKKRKPPVRGQRKGGKGDNGDKLLSINQYSKKLPPRQQKQIAAITPKQENYLLRLIARYKKPAYWAAKARLHIPKERTIPNLSKSEASRLISELLESEKC